MKNEKQIASSCIHAEQPAESRSRVCKCSGPLSIRDVALVTEEVGSSHGFRYAFRGRRCKEQFSGFATVPAESSFRPGMKINKIRHEAITWQQTSQSPGVSRLLDRFHVSQRYRCRAEELRMGAFRWL